MESLKISNIQKTWKYAIVIVKSVNIERYATTKIYLFISAPGANHVMLM